ncbi:MAG: nicotinamide-nucleotide amidohydrolase family protein [Candidatus Hydrogenedentes bacterium]|nr:nicotinamide-nucleotide amidohydrolase family protein [Candidatus Hydrogenedentota bacterium]
MQCGELDKAIAAKLVASASTLSTAESCSGGLVAHRITNVSGSSKYFIGGVVAYGNGVKKAILGVPQDILDKHGAVSEPVARAMAEGAKRVFATNYAIGVTGIAGPDGGSAEKPVGMVFISVAGPRATVVAECRFAGSREQVKEDTAIQALTLLLEQLE